MKAQSGVITGRQ